MSPLYLYLQVLILLIIALILTNFSKVELIKNIIMGTVYCRECGEKISERVSTCPNCGAPTQITSAGKCEYCGSVQDVIIPPEQTMVVNNIKPEASNEPENIKTPEREEFENCIHSDEISKYYEFC